MYVIHPLYFLFWVIYSTFTIPDAKYSTGMECTYIASEGKLSLCRSWLQVCNVNVFVTQLFLIIKYGRNDITVLITSYIQQFLPWKKLYHQFKAAPDSLTSPLLLHPDQMKEQVPVKELVLALSDHHAISDLENCLVNIIKWEFCQSYSPTELGCTGI